MTYPWRYGVCPAQLSGVVLETNSPFYFRSRGGGWTLSLGEPGWIPNLCAWPKDRDRHQLIIASGRPDLEDADRIDALVTALLGPWRHVEWEETTFDMECKCGRTFRSDGSTICMDCLAKALGFTSE